MDLDPSQYSEADRLRRGKVKAPESAHRGAFFWAWDETPLGTGGDDGATRHICGLAQRMPLHPVSPSAQ
jgi:hypothetical protein